MLPWRAFSAATAGGIDMARPTKLPRLPAAVTTEVERLAADAVARAVGDSDARALALIKLGDLAAKHGVIFDVAAAIAGNVSLVRARRQLGDAMADASEALPTLCRSTSASTEQANSKAEWDAAAKAVAGRLGIAS